MELKKIVLGVALAMGVATFAQAEEPVAPTTPTDQGSGTVTFKGSIIDAPCSIVGNKDQTVEMGQISNSMLADGNTSVPADFSIELAKCNLADKYKSVSVTFTGAEGKIENSLGMSKATGASIIMQDGASNKIKLGTPTALQTLANGSNTLSFSAYVQGNPGETVQLGEFDAITSFTLAYQ